MELSVRGLLFILLLSGTALLHADTASHYSRGLEAARAEDWPALQRHMEAALREQPEATLRARFPGMRGEPYVPQYYLGLAAYRQDDCRSARRIWSRPEVMSVIDRLPGLKSSVEAALTDCTQRLAQLRPATATDPEPEPAVAQTAAPSSTETRAPPPRVAQATATAGAPPRALRAALDSFLDGRYGDVLDLDPSTLPDARARAHGFLLRAAARHHLGQLGDALGSDERALREDARAARRELPTLKVDATVFSPRFRSRFEELTGRP